MFWFISWYLFGMNLFELETCIFIQWLFCTARLFSVDVDTTYSTLIASNNLGYHLEQLNIHICKICHCLHILQLNMPPPTLRCCACFSVCVYQHEHWIWQAWHELGEVLCFCSLSPWLKANQILWGPIQWAMVENIKFSPKFTDISSHYITWNGSFSVNYL